MDEERFKLLVNVVKILKSHHADSIKGAFEIINKYSEHMTHEQKARILDEILHFAKGIDIKTQKFEEELREEKIRQFMKGDYS